jgi:hypothetical protein
MVMISAIFLKKIGSGRHRVAQNSVTEGEVLLLSMPGKKKVSEHRSGLYPSEKELPDSGALRHKNTPGYNESMKQIEGEKVQNNRMKTSVLQ